MKFLDFLKPFFNFYSISLVLYIISLFSTIYTGTDFRGYYSGAAPYSSYLGIEGLLFGWTFTIWAVIPWLSNILYGYLILFGRFFPYLRTIISLAMVSLSLFIFKLDEVKVSRWKFYWNYELEIEIGIYYWLVAIILLALHFFLADWKHYKNL